MRRPCELTTEEQENVRAALRVLKLRCGSLKALASAIRYSHITVRNMLGRQAISAGVAVAVARLAGVLVDDVLSGKFPPVGTCPYCGHRRNDFVDEETTP